VGNPHKKQAALEKKVKQAFPEKKNSNNIIFIKSTVIFEKRYQKS